LLRVFPHYHGSRRSAQAGGVRNHCGTAAQIEIEVQCGAIEAANSAVHNRADACGFAWCRRAGDSDGHGKAKRARHQDELAKSGQSQLDKGFFRAHGAFRSAQKCPSSSKEHEAFSGVSAQSSNVISL
jgi:hypothetical protein